MKRDLDSTLQSFKDKVRLDVNTLEDKVQQLSQTIPTNHYSSSDKQLKIVIRGLAYHVGENLNTKVNNLIKKGLQVNNVSVLDTERKTTNNTSSAGIVIASFQSADEVKTILSSKTKLKDSQQYENVFIYKDQTMDERSLNRNMKTLVNALRQKGCNISFRGNRVVTYEIERGNDSSRDHRYNSVSNGKRDYSYSRSGKQRSESDKNYRNESVKKNNYT